MIDPSKNEYITKMFNDGLYKSYRKKEATLLRKPLTPEIETVLHTYVGGHKESSSIIKNNSVIARNIMPIDDIYNEWVISYDEAVKIYGKNEIDSLTCEFTPLLKKQIIKAIKLTENVFKDLSASEPASAGSCTRQGLNLKEAIYIKVSWSNEPMVGKINDYLTSTGYIIAEKFIDSYELITEGK